MWWAVRPLHQRVARYLLENAVRVMAREQTLTPEPVSAHRR
jgi:hypothetical protein